MMSDRITQLQDVVNQLAEHMCNSVGILQQSSTPGSFSGLEKPVVKDAGVANNESVALFCNLITRTVKDIDVLIESLPSKESTPELQAQYLAKLEQENMLAVEQLSALVRKGEENLTRIQQALVDIAQAQLEARKIEANLVCGVSPSTSLPSGHEITGDFSDLPQR